MLHTYIRFPRQGTYDFLSSPIPPYRFRLSWEPPSLARLGLNPFPKLNTSLARHSFTLPGGLSDYLWPEMLTMLQRLSQTLLNNRLCMVMPLLVAVCDTPFTALRRLILPYEVFQL
jgi:hypothetical protein